jgi:hypothetical protein
VIWRWDGPRYGWAEKPLRRAWPGWSFKDSHGGAWQEQMRITGRSPDGLAGGEEHILGVTVAELLTESSGDPRAMFGNVARLARGARQGCAGVTVAMAVALGLAIWLNSTAATFLAAIAFGACLFGTIWLWRRTANTLGVLDMMNAFPKDAAVPAGPTLEEKHERLNSVLSRLGYPSIEQLKSSGQWPRGFEDDDDEDDEE